MSIDFTGVTAVQIPEGNATKIVRKSDGAVLWEKPVSNTFTITSILGENAATYEYAPENARVEVNGQILYCTEETAVVPAGTTLYAYACGWMRGASIKLNGVVVASASGSDAAEYTMQVNSNLTVEFRPAIISYVSINEV